jgi:hypothetical protein
MLKPCDVEIADVTSLLTLTRLSITSSSGCTRFLSSMMATGFSVPSSRNRYRHAAAPGEPLDRRVYGGALIRPMMHLGFEFEELSVHPVWGSLHTP